MKPIKYPGDKDPVQNITQCPHCFGAISEKDAVPFCHNCNETVDVLKGKPYKGCVPDKGERDPEFGPKDIFVNKNIPFLQKVTPFDQRQKSAKSQDHLKRDKEEEEEEDFAEHDKDTVRTDVFISDEVKMCRYPERKNRKFDDKEDVMRSCEDLAIDG